MVLAILCVVAVPPLYSDTSLVSSRNVLLLLWAIAAGSGTFDFDF